MKKLDVIVAAVEAGYFRTKSADKKNTIAEELAKAKEWDFAGMLAILNKETQKRADAYQKAQAKRIAKAEADEAKPVAGGVENPDAVITDAPKHDVYVITTAQNNTHCDEKFLAALRTYCRERGAHLMVGKTTYNKGAFAQPEVNDDTLWYDPEIMPNLVHGHIRITPNLHFFADANVIPTAKNPLQGFEGLTPAGVDCIIPAVKIALKCAASLKGARGKILHATGAVTLRNYILRKAGAVAQAEHNIGALVVEIAHDGSHTVRQLERMPNESGFYDNGIYYDINGASMGHDAAALQFGDIHAEKMTPTNLAKCLHLIRHFAPERVLIHDVLDFSSRNHHNIKDPLFVFKTMQNKETVAGDLERVAQVLDAFAEEAFKVNPDSQLDVIESNHDLAINTWLKNADFKLDPVNAPVYLRCMLAWYESIAADPSAEFNMLQYAYTAIGGGTAAEMIQFHMTDESVVIAGVEMGCHGHSGVNGARGSPQGFRTLGVPMNTGHTHTPSICGGVYTAGVSASLEMGYNIGPSSWHLAHIVTWPNGQRQIIFA